MANMKLVPLRTTHLITSDLQLTGSRIQKNATKLIEELKITMPSFVLLAARRSIDSTADFLSSVECWVLTNDPHNDARQLIVTNQVHGGLRDMDRTLFIEGRIVVVDGVIQHTVKPDMLNQRRPLWHIVGEWPIQSVGPQAA